MQRSLLPRSEPRVEGLEIGDRLRVLRAGRRRRGRLRLPHAADGGLAVVLGDVTGHGIEAAADMAMAKFVFRSLTREHPQPGDFLASANEVVAGEIATGKFITLRLRPRRGRFGRVRERRPSGAASHEERRRDRRAGGAGPRARGRRGPDLRRGARPVRAGRHARSVHGRPRRATARDELYGTERLDEVLVGARDLPARQLARAVLADCRAFGSGDLTDDCAIVVIKRTNP